MKKSSLRKFRALVGVLIFALAFAATAFSLTASASSEGMSFAADKYFDQQKLIAPEGSLTAEAEVWFSVTDAASTAPGFIIGNYTSASTVFSTTLDIQKGGKVRFHTQHNNGSFSASNSSVTFATVLGEDYVGTEDAPKYVKISVTVDVSTGNASLYLNGEYKETKTNAKWKGYDFSVQDLPLRVGGDYRSGNTKTFRGKVKNITFYEDLRTAEEIAADAAKSTYSPDANDPALLFAYDLTDTSIEGYLNDLSKNDNDAINPNVFHNGLTVDRYNDPETTADYPNAYYESNTKLDEIPETLEAWVYIPSYMSSSRVGVIMGNYSGFGDYDAHLNFEVYNNRVPRIQWYNHANHAKYDIKFSNSALPVSEWVHLALIYDSESGVASCYVNGELSEEKYFYPALDGRVIDYPYCLAGDNRNLNTAYFKGALGDVTMYSDVRTADEIKADYQKGKEMTAANADLSDALCYYDIDKDDKCQDIKDESGNGKDMVYSKTWLSEAEMEEIRKSYGFDPAYSFAVIGDTQYTTRKYPENLPTLYKWIANNVEAKNIKYAIGLGDITDANGVGTDANYDKYTFIPDESDELGGGYWVIDQNGTGNEWDVAFHSITILDGHLEYSLIRGNHDIKGTGNGFNEYFASHDAYISQFVEKGGIYGWDGKSEITDAANTWRTLTVGNVKYIILNLDFGANDDILAWASEVIDREEFKDYSVIVNTHGYLYADYTTIDGSDCSAPTFVSGTNNNGDDMWLEFVSRHENIKLALCGHIYTNKVPYNQVKGENGNTVTEILVDPQVFDNSLHGLGVVAMFYFSEDGEKIAIEYYSTVRDQYFKTVNQFVVDLSAEGEVREAEGWDGVQEKPLGSGTASDPYLISNAGNLLWMSKQIKKTSYPTFAGAYFEQICDIDLNGTYIKSIGYYFASESNMAAFGGHYNGNGYSIKNGIIEVAVADGDLTCNYGYGLFGAIFGATVENIVLDNVKVTGRGVTGAIVGIAASPRQSGVIFEKFNVISGCQVKDNVTIISALPGGTIADDKENFDNTYRGGRVGGVVGMAHGTLIDGCYSGADCILTADFGIAGGIAGSIGLNTTVSNSANTGDIILYDDAKYHVQTCVYGGIVGMISPTTQWTKTYSGYAHITDCYNKGNLLFDGVIAKNGGFKKNTHWAGILGSGCWINYCAPTEDMPYPFLIDNCYNLSEGPVRYSTTNTQVIAGITAKNLVTVGETSTLFVRNCYSVTVSATTDVGTNEVRYGNKNLSKDGYLAAYILENVGTKAASEMASYVAAIDSAVENTTKSRADVSWYNGQGNPRISVKEAGAKYFNVTSLLYYVSDGTKWVFEDGLGDYEETKYGIISGAFVDADKYPFALFSEEVGFIGAYADLGEATAAAVSNGVNGNYTVLMRKDGVQNVAASLGSLRGNLLLDLDGHVLTKQATAYMFDVYVNDNSSVMEEIDERGNFKVINGYIVKAGGNALICVNYGDKLVKTYTTSFEFENVTFSSTSGTNVVFQIWENGFAATPDNVSVKVNASFTDCTFDYVNSKAGAVMLGLNKDGKDKTVFDVKINGGKILANSPVSFNTFAHLDGNTNGRADKVVLGQGSDGKYLTLVLPEGASAPSTSDVWVTEDGIELIFKKGSTENGNTTYAVVPKAINEYKVKTNITLWSSFVYNIYLLDSESLKEAYLNGMPVDLSGCEKVSIGGVTYYKVSVPLASDESLDDIKISVVLKSGETTVKSSYTFSIFKYAKAIIGGDYSTEEKQLLKDILSYAKAAYAHFDKNSDKIAEINTLLGEGYDEANAPDMTKPALQPTKDKGFDKVTVNLGSAPSFRFYLSDGFDADDFTFTAGGVSVDAVFGSDSEGDYLEVVMYAYRMCYDVSFTVEIDGNKYTESYNIYSYYNYVKETYATDAELIALVERLVKYCESAYAYREYVNSSNEDCKHAYDLTDKRKATATEEGYLEYTCKVCGDSYKEAIPTTLKILAVGNSFSVDAMEHLYILCKDFGIENVVLGNLYYGGCSLDSHLQFMTEGSGSYTFYLSNTETGKMATKLTSATADYGLTYDDWDFITVQQASGKSGKPDTYDTVNAVIDYIRTKNSEAVIYWHMTWAYQNGYSGLSAYNNSQDVMYSSIVSAVQAKILTNTAISGIIPSGTAVQNIRTSPLGDTLTRDGFHLSYGIGRYTAALTWLAYFTGCDIDKITAVPSSYPEINDNIVYIKEAIKAAIANPFEITESQYAPEEPDVSNEPLIPSTLSPLSEADREYLISKGYDPDEFMLLDLEITENAYYNSLANATLGTSNEGNWGKFLATQMFTKDELPYGSLIRINEGYQYRPEGWINLQKNTARPDNVKTELVEIDQAWWGDYTHRAFNINKSPITAAEAENFKIYIKIVKRAELNADDVEYLTSLGLDADEYMVLDFDYFVNSFYNSTGGTNMTNTSSSLNANLAYRFIATEFLSKYDLTLGTVIRNTSGYGYRPEGWTDLGAKNASGDRPANVTTETVIVDAEWWHAFLFRAFNIYKADNSNVTEADVSALRIYVKI